LKSVGVIPARWGSTRFPGKPLALIAGKPLLEWVIEGAKSAKSLGQVIVATDDDRIAKFAEKCGVTAAMTDSNLPTGTDRVWQAARKSGADVIVNIQGDEPLIDGRLLDRLVAPFALDNELQMATLGRALDEESLKSETTAKIVLNERGEAIYFSRFPIPYSRQNSVGLANLTGSLKHIGIYAYRRGFLERFCSQKPTELESFEGLEQLRALYLGARIKVVKVEHDSWGVDTPDDVAKIEKIMNARQKSGGPR
jgi:3-deoxy-manno-octulosonate cytidylyltransferase (CMP-KDO synthetase)